MKIIKANYGGRDCTEQLNNKIKNDKLMARVSNNIVGDPKIGQVKFLEMGYEHEGKVTIRAGHIPEIIKIFE